MNKKQNKSKQKTQINKQTKCKIKKKLTVKNWTISFIITTILNEISMA